MPIKREPKPLVLRQSAVNLFLACPKAYELTYLRHLPSLTTPPLLEGTTMHSVVEKNNRHKAKTMEDLTAGELVSFWDDTWADNKKQIEDWEEENPDDIQLRGRALIKHYRQYVAKSIVPRDENSIEMPVEGLVGGVSMTGIIDLIAEADGPVVKDYKVVKQRKTESEAESGIQLGVYAILSDILRVGFISFVKTKEPKVESVTVDRTPKSLEKVHNVIRGVAQAIQTGVFPYTDPANWKCSQKYCGVWWACKQGGGDQ